MKKVNVFQLLLVCSFIFPLSVFSQHTKIYDNPEAEYLTALELFDKEKFGAAQKKFEDLAENIPQERSAMKADAEFHAALCALELYNRDAEYLITTFIKTHPEYSKAKSAFFKLGNYLYSNKKYRKALKAYEQVEIYELSNEEYYEYYFRTGYSNFLLKKFDLAKNAFYEIKDRSNIYASASKYYFGHIEYLNGNNETALKEFEKLVNDEKFGMIVPYYIIQIYYLQERYIELLQVAPPMMENATAKRLPEIARLIGESYYRTEQYTEAIPYLEKYHETTTSSINQIDYYQLGYVYYKAGKYKQSIEAFKKVTYSSDSLSQNAYYHIADCYIKTNQKNFARTAFATAYKMPFDAKIKEDALFNYAKLSYDLSLNPYNDAINAFQKYIANYPNLKKTDEAREYLVNMYLSTNNYKDALTSIEAIKSRNNQLSTAYQRICYYRGVELFNTGNLKEAVKLFNKSGGMYYDPSIKALSYYWKAEAYYRLNKPDSSLAAYKKFLIMPQIADLNEHNLCHYNLGYLYFNKKDYKNSLYYFRKFAENLHKEPPKIANDAYLRIGDCLFITKDYNNAIAYYDKAIKINSLSTDYAYYQKAISLGVLGEYTPKVTMLKTLIENYSESTHAIDAKYELAITYQLTNNHQQALNYYNEIVENHPNSIYVKKCLLKIGLIHYNARKDEKALEVFNNIVNNYPGTPEAREAYKQVKNIYVDLNKIDDFLAWSENVTFASVSNSEQDSLSYSAVENKYMDGNCEVAITGFANYIQKFPNGFFILPSHYYKAECEFNAKKYGVALTGFEFVLTQSKNNFTENSLLKAAWIHFQNENYDNALLYYNKLEKNADFKNNLLTARAGMMRCNYYLNQYRDAIISAKRLLRTAKASNEQINEAHYIIAKSAIAIDSVALAQAEFGITSKMNNSKIAAESKYYLAFLQFELGNIEKAEQMIYDIIQQDPSEDYWIAKSFLLLSDIYIQKGNNFQAKQTLQGIIDSYKGTDLLKQANEKLNAILELEKKEQEKKEQDAIEVDLGESEGEELNEFDLNSE